MVKSLEYTLMAITFKPFFEGKEKKGPRDEVYYFSAAGMLNAIRVKNFKIAFATERGAINEAIREVPAWPLITNLRADPFESAQKDSAMYLRWYADNMWMMIPAQNYVQKFLGSIEGYPFQEGMSLTAGNIGYNTLKMKKAAGQFQKLLKASPIN